MNKYLEKIASTEDLVNAGFGAGLGYGSEVLALKNPESKFLKSLTFGHKGMGAAVGAASNVIAGRVVKSFMNKQASDYEYSGPSNWQTAGIVGAGILGSAAMGARARHNLDKVLKPHGLKAANIAELRAAYGKNKLHPEVMDAMKTVDEATSNIGIPAALGLSAIPAVALHRQYQDYKSGNKDPHYGRGALLGSVAGTAALGTPLGLMGGAAAGLGAVGLNHAHNKYMNNIASKQSDLEANEAFQKMKAQRGKVPSEQKGPLPGTPEKKKPIKTIGAEQGRANIEAELARQKQQAEAERVASRPLNKPGNVALRMRRDAEHERMATQPREVPTTHPDAADGRYLNKGRNRMKEQRLARKAQVETATTASHVPPPTAAAAEDTFTRTAKMLSKYKKPALALGALGLSGYALSGRDTDTGLHNE